jgi:GTP-binding protein LepA
VDFTYEVSRSLAACEGAVLIVDATQGVEAQTLANVYLALAEDLEILPVINKIDLASARPDEAKQEIEDIIGIDAHDAPLISAKEGIGIEDVLEAVVAKIPAPKGDAEGKLKALIFDSYYDNYRGVVIYTRVFDGKNQKRRYDSPDEYKEKIRSDRSRRLRSRTGSGQRAFRGEIGYVCASIKQVADARVGDTITLDADPTEEPLPGYKKVQPMVYCGIYPAGTEKYENVKDALEKLQVNDAAFHFEPETSTALGFGFRCGFLGLLHMEIIVERLEREFDLGIITTAPSVIYKVVLNDGREEMIQNPSNLPSPIEIRHIEEPIVKADIMIPKEYVGSIMEICQERRGKMLHMEYITENRVALHYEMPLNEVIYDFFDALKSKTEATAPWIMNSSVTRNPMWLRWTFF